MPKICKKCNLFKEDRDFYWDSFNKRLLAICKECHIKKCKIYFKSYFKSKKGKMAWIKATKKSQMKYPEKCEARRLTKIAIRKGELIKMPCELCGEDKSEIHHRNYAEPLLVNWLCRKHHRGVHKLLRSIKLINLTPPSPSGREKRNENKVWRNKQNI